MDGVFFFIALCFLVFVAFLLSFPCILCGFTLLIRFACTVFLLISCVFKQFVVLARLASSLFHFSIVIIRACTVLT